MIDSHCHLTDKQYENEVDKIVSNFLQVGVEKVITIGYDPQHNLKAIELSNKYDCVYCAIGIHPDDCAKYNEQELEKLLINKNNKLVAVGEIGLDYFHNKDNKDKQKRVFESQIMLANKYKLPIVIHCRDAYGDTLEILKKYAPFKFGAVMHCYSGSWEYAKELLKLGVKFSFTGTVTYKNAKNVQEVAKNLPIDSFFFETDSPYLTPTPYRGQRNEPKHVVEVAKFVAELRDLPYKELEKITDNSAKSLFNLH
ncbi:MAG: TatD family hydrolase [Clostridia bacterium]|nr:TatD family hydrolase [Clostridia bacterium]